MVRLYLKNGAIREIPHADQWGTDWEEPATVEMYKDDALIGTFLISELQGWCLDTSA